MIEPTILQKDDFFIVKDFIEKNAFSRPGALRKYTVGAAIHNTGNPSAWMGAQGTRDYFEKLKNQDSTDKVRDRYASTPFIVGRDPYILQVYPHSEIGYHIGATWDNYTQFSKDILKEYQLEATVQIGNWAGKSMNHLYIGIEMVNVDHQGHFTDDTIDSGIKLCAWLANLYTLDLDNPRTLIRHYDATGKICPKFYVDNPDAWLDFKRQVRLLV